MSHNYDPKTAARAYLYRIFTASRPRSITICSIVGSTRIMTYDLSDYYAELHTDQRDEWVARAIRDDQRRAEFLCHSEVKEYVLVIDGRALATYDTTGKFLHDSTEHRISAVETRFVTQDKNGEEIEFRTIDDRPKPKLGPDH